MVSKKDIASSKTFLIGWRTHSQTMAMASEKIMAVGTSSLMEVTRNLLNTKSSTSGSIGRNV